MRIRKPFAAAFIAICLLSALLGFSPSDYKIPTYKQSDKALHFLAFFAVTVTFYWILETNRRKVIQLTFGVCTLGLGVASEVVQSLLPIGREFDPVDVFANVLGSGVGLALCNWYHKRMLERKRAARGYGAVAGDDFDERDIELGESTTGQETGVTRPTVEEELENWDDNAEDWEDTEQAAGKNVENGGDLGTAKRNND